MKLELYFQQVLRKRKISPSRSWQTVQLSIPPGKGITYYFLFLSYTISIKAFEPIQVFNWKLLFPQLMKFR